MDFLDGTWFAILSNPSLIPGKGPTKDVVDFHPHGTSAKRRSPFSVVHQIGITPYRPLMEPTSHAVDIVHSNAGDFTGSLLRDFLLTICVVSDPAFGVRLEDLEDFRRFGLEDSYAALVPCWCLMKPFTHMTVSYAIGSCATRDFNSRKGKPREVTIPDVRPARLDYVLHILLAILVIPLVIDHYEDAVVSVPNIVTPILIIPKPNVVQDSLGWSVAVATAILLLGSTHCFGEHNKALIYTLESRSYVPFKLFPKLKTPPNEGIRTSFRTANAGKIGQVLSQKKEK